MRYVRALTVAVLIFLAGIPLTLAQPAAAVDSDHLIVPGVGIGKVRLGQHITDAIKVLGKPRGKKVNSEGTADVFWFNYTDTDIGSRGGVGLYVTTSIDGTITWVHSFYDASYATSEGLRVGSSELRVRSVLGKPLGSRSFNDGKVQLLVYPGIVFRIINAVGYGAPVGTVIQVSVL